MSKFGADISDTATVSVVMGRFGPAHAIRQHNGSYVVCPRRAELCVLCAKEGVPHYPPDPFEVAFKLLVDNWGKRWIESDRHHVPQSSDEVWPADGIHICAVDDETDARTVVASFGANDSAMGSISALVAAHNHMIGEPGW